MPKKRRTDKGLEKPAEFNPAIYEILFFAFRLVAKMLKEMGVLSDLQAKADETENEMDDKGVRIAKTILDEMAK